MVKLIKGELKKMTSFPKEIRLDQASVVTDVKKFFNSHLSVVEANEGRVKEVFGRRLAITLPVVGINPLEYRKKAEEQIKKEFS